MLFLFMWKVGRQSIKVNLRIVNEYDFELINRIPDYDGLIRILCDIRFKTVNGWAIAESAIIDTGAFTSLLPLSLWEELEVEILADYFVRGLVPKKDCKIDVKIGWIKGKIVDKTGNTTPETKFRAFLAMVDNIPLVIGFKDLLEKFKLIINSINKIAYLEY